MVPVPATLSVCACMGRAPPRSRLMALRPPIKISWVIEEKRVRERDCGC
jgi:hypothetical protein